MAVLKTYIKQPGDRLDYDFDYSAWLNPDDEIISAEFAVEFLGSPVPAVIMTDDATVSTGCDQLGLKPSMSIMNQCSGWSSKLALTRAQVPLL